MLDVVHKDRCHPPLLCSCESVAKQGVWVLGSVAAAWYKLGSQNPGLLGPLRTTIGRWRWTFEARHSSRFLVNMTAEVAAKFALETSAARVLWNIIIPNKFGASGVVHTIGAPISRQFTTLKTRLWYLIRHIICGGTMADSKLFALRPSAGKLSGVVARGSSSVRLMPACVMFHRREVDNISAVI